MKRILLLSLLVILLPACGSDAPTTTEVEVTRVVESVSEVEVTRLVETVTEVEVTRLVEVVSEVEVTRLVETVATPTPEPEPTAVPASDDIIALNDVASAESGGIAVDIARVLVGNKSSIEQDFSRDPSFDNVDVVGMIIFKVRNTTDETISVYPDQASVQINSELVELLDFFLAGFGDDVSGDIPPDVELIGGQWFGINRNAVADVTEMTLRFSGPISVECCDKLGDDFEIVLDLSNRTFEPIPQDLLDALQ